MSEDDDIFRAEAEGLVESLEACLLSLRDRPRDTELINRVFRDLHTLKGSGSMFGRDDIASFLHDFETAFEKVRDGSVALDASLIAISLEASDHVAQLLGGGDPQPGSGLLARLAAVLASEEESSANGDVADDGGDAEAFDEDFGGYGSGGDDGEGPNDHPPMSPDVLTGRDWRRFRFWMGSETLVLGGRPDLVLAELRNLGVARIRPLFERFPALETFDPTVLHIGWEGWLPTDVSDEKVRDVFMFHEDGLTLEFDLVRPQEDAPVPEVFRAEGARSAATNTLSTKVENKPVATAAPMGKSAAHMRVPAERLDDMMNRVGELVIAEARLIELARESGDSNLIAVAEDIQRLTTAMRDTTMSIRMTPIGAISGRFRRLIHDLSAKLGKPITFETVGEETELDKTVVEQLTDPLMHIIRNAVDHGLESPERRSEMGKPTEGLVTLSARYSGAEVLISLADDGRGLDRHAILKRAVERGLVAEGADLTSEEVNKLIFEPGFSTAQQVTELSGRGVGMDVVKRTIESLRGSLDVKSEPGHGTNVILRLPLTLAIIDGLLIEVGGERFVIPLAAVTEIVELPEHHARETDRNAFLDIRESLVPFLRLRTLLFSGGEPPLHQKVIVVTAGEGRVGLVVDRIIGSNQTVIKQLSPLHSGLKAFSGATILGNGSVAMILDVPQLVSIGKLLADGGREAA